jgi:hypothetical protein
MAAPGGILCPWCGEPVPPSTRKPRIYCSRECGMKMHRAFEARRRAAMKPDVKKPNAKAWPPRMISKRALNDLIRKAGGR